MIISRKIVLTGVITLGVFALGSAGAAVAHTLTIEDRTGEVQNIAPVTTGANSPSPSESSSGDQSEDPTDSASPSPSESPSGDQSEDPTDSASPSPSESSSGDQSEDPTGSASPSPSESSSGDQSEDPTGTATVAPAPPVNLHENDSAVDNTGVEH
jgi:hypothetical protein